VNILGSNDRHALVHGPIEDVAMQRRANADLDHMVRVDKAFLDRVVERRTVPPDETEALGPGVDMSVEMHEPQRALAPRQGAQQRKRDRVIAAKCHQVRERRRLFLDLCERACDVAMCNPEITDIGNIQPLDRGPRGRMIAVDQHPARLADRRRPKPRPGPVRGTKIERNPGNADRCFGARALDAEKARSSGKSRDGDHGLYLGEATTG
jgi:hypothetical protein